MLLQLVILMKIRNCLKYSKVNTIILYFAISCGQNISLLLFSDISVVTKII